MALSFGGLRLFESLRMLEQFRLRDASWIGRDVGWPRSCRSLRPLEHSEESIAAVEDAKILVDRRFSSRLERLVESEEWITTVGYADVLTVRASSTPSNWLNGTGE